MKSVAEQSVAELGGPVSVLSRQKRDHIKLDQLLDRLGESRTGEEEAILLNIYRLVFPHAHAEETVL
ncbi:MAG: hemerythrin domain-containing protein, partial [Pseudomonadota bacterium]|nr:hemerythrin domain-containing protein [Pseudomonadota bacterium]